MDKAMLGLTLAVIGMFLGVFAMCFMSFISATILYFIWNALAPIYFVTFLPAVFMHLSWWHCFMFMWLIGLVSGRFSSMKMDYKG